MNSIEMENKVRELMALVLADESLAVAHGPDTEKKYRLVHLTVESVHAGMELEWGIYAGGRCDDLQWGKTLDEVFKKLRGFDPEEKRRREIARLKATLATLECPELTATGVPPPPDAVLAGC